jgi:lysyl-tRNA synthetase class I
VNVPAPEGSSAPNYARHFVGLFRARSRARASRPGVVLDERRAMPRARWTPTSCALDQAATIREIYGTVSTVDHPDHWLPISVICENTGAAARPSPATGTGAR